MRSIRKPLALVALAIATTLALTGCIKFDVALTVSDKDTVSGQATVAISKQLAAMGIPDSSSNSSTDQLFAEGEGVTSEPFDDGAFVGSTYKFDSVPLVNFSSGGSDSGQISIVREGENLITSGSLDMGSASSDESNPFAKSMMSGMASTADMSISITYPGEILETNGVIDGQTVTWSPKLGEVTSLDAIVKAPLTNYVPLLVGGGIALLVIAGVVTLMVIRRKKATTAAAPVSSGSAGASPAESISE
ncbi:MAG: hypothetical protein JJE28_02420 [Actinomycetales bacterium]|nr:hypothetical protein [Actinomycetales bacterium]